jgi:tyrosine-protein kinase Etk/Wzc
MQTKALAEEIAPSLSQDSSEVDVLDLLVVLAKNKRMIVFATLGGTLVAILISFLIPSMYTSTTRLLPPQQTQSSAVAMLAQMNPLAALVGKDLGIKNPSDIYIGILNSRTVQDALINRFDLRKVYRYKTYQDARKKLEDRSDIRAGKDGIITIFVEDRSSKRAAEIANAYVTELRKVTQSLSVGEASQRRVFFEQQVQMARAELVDAEAALRETQEKTGLIQLEGQAKAIIESAAMLKAQIATKKVQLERMRLFATPQNPDFRGSEQELSGLEQQLALLEQKQSAGNGDIQIATSRVPAAGLEYVRRLREVKYREAVFELLAKQFEAAKLDEAKNAAIIQVIDQAVEPEKRSSPKRLLIISLGSIFALLLSCLYASFRESFHNLLTDPSKAIKLRILLGHLSTQDWRAAR